MLSKRETGEAAPDGSYPEGRFNEAVRQALLQNIERLKAMRGGVVEMGHATRRSS